MANSSGPVGIYIHIPFCLHKCQYCDFYSLPITDAEVLEDYTHSIIRELKHRGTLIKSPIATVFFGGGTPSLLKPQQVERILEAVFAICKISGELEISLETNPATVKLQNLKDLRRVGINRLSIGVQSFNDNELRVLGRMHDGLEARMTLQDVVKAGFNNYNIDLIYGLPNQTLASWQDTLHWTLKFNPQHISAYLLQLDDSTPMARKVKSGTLKMLDDEAESSLYYTTLDSLTEAGFHHYEISNFSRPGYECRHNLLYWQAREYLGVGCGAVSYINGQRFLNQAGVDKYIENSMADRPLGIEILETMTPRQMAADAIILGLRLIEGIRFKEFKDRFGFDTIGEYRDVITSCQDKGLLQMDKESFYLTKKGYFLSNQVLNQFIV